jgi:hypothetical protein
MRGIPRAEKFFFGVSFLAVKEFANLSGLRDPEPGAKVSVNPDRKVGVLFEKLIFD